MHNQILTSVPYEKLLNDLTERLRQVMPQLQATPPPPEKKDDLITRKETATLLGITLPTLHTWSLQGKLKAYRIGTRVRYKRNEVMLALNVSNK
jgi:excisionase family DNA binding protein